MALLSFSHLGQDHGDHNAQLYSHERSKLRTCNSPLFADLQDHNDEDGRYVLGEFVDGYSEKNSRLLVVFTAQMQIAA